MTTTVNDLRLRIRALPANLRRKEVAEIAFELEYLSLLVSPLPKDIFSLYLEVLSDPLVFSKNGIDNFISAIYNEFEKLTSDQESTLLESIVNNSKEYNNEKLRFSVGDMIARKYPVQVALDAFRRMWFSGEKTFPDHCSIWCGRLVFSATQRRTGAQQASQIRFGNGAKREIIID